MRICCPILRRCARIAEQFDPAKKQKDFAEVEYGTLNIADRQRSKRDDYMTENRFNSEHCVERPYITEFDWRDRRLVRSRLDKGLMTRLGY